MPCSIGVDNLKFREATVLVVVAGAYLSFWLKRDQL